MLGGGAGRQTAAADLLPAQADLLLELLNLRVAVPLLLAPHFPTQQVVLHQLDGSDQGLRDAEMSVLLQNREISHIVPNHFQGVE